MGCRMRFAQRSNPCRATFKPRWTRIRGLEHFSRLLTGLTGMQSYGEFKRRQKRRLALGRLSSHARGCGTAQTADFAAGVLAPGPGVASAAVRKSWGYAHCIPIPGRLSMSTPEKNLFYCHGCHCGGDLIPFVELSPSGKASPASSGTFLWSPSPTRSPGPPRVGEVWTNRREKRRLR